MHGNSGLGQLVRGGVATLCLASMAVAAADDPIVIGHRGASGYRPEHTIEAYVLAIQQGADFIEPDLVATKDGVLIARHENALAVVALDENDEIIYEHGHPIVLQETTDVAEKPEFAELLTVKSIDGVAVGGWFAEDMTLAEVKSLRCRERIPGTRPQNTEFNDMFQVPTLSEVILLVKIVELTTGIEIGIYPETKHPTFFAEEGTFVNGDPIDMSLGQMLIDTLILNDFTDPDRIFIQSFEFANLIELQNTIMPNAGVDIPLVQLYGDVDECCVQPGSSFSRPYDMIYYAGQGADLKAIYGGLTSLVRGGISTDTHYGDLISAAVINYIADNYAEGMGPWKNSFLLRDGLAEPVDGNGDGEAQITSQLNGRVRPFLGAAFNAGLMVHPYTLRSEENFLTVHANGVPQSITGEVLQLLGLGVNGFFIDQPDAGVVGRNLFLAANGQASGAAASGPVISDEDVARILTVFDAASSDLLPREIFE